NKGVKANKIPTTGQDATLQGMANVLTGFQCGSVYKAVYLEAQAAVALATVLRANATPPPALVNGNTSPPSGQQGNQQPAVLLVPIWVDKTNMKDTVLKDNFVKTADLCSPRPSPGSTSRTTGRSCGKATRSTSAPRATPRAWGSRRSTRTSPWRTTSTSSRTCFWDVNAPATGCSTRTAWSGPPKRRWRACT